MSGAALAQGAVTARCGLLCICSTANPVKVPSSGASHDASAPSTRSSAVGVGTIAAVGATAAAVVAVEMATAFENADVSPAGLVAVALITCPEATAGRIVTAKLATPLLLVVTETVSRNF